MPVHTVSQFWFAFTCQEKQYTWTRLPQGYCERPTIFLHLNFFLHLKMCSPKGSKILLYVDDMSLVFNTEEHCCTDTIALLTFLAEHGHKVSKNKLQLVR